jgi:hypothetical protein
MGARTTLTDAWPLFGLRLRTERLVLRLPTDDHLVHLMALARAGIHPPDEMPFGVAWSTIPSPAFERSFMQYHWSMRGLWSPTKWSLNLVTLLDGDPIGSQGIDAEAFAVHRTVSTGSWLGQAFQGRRFWGSSSMGSERAWPRARPSSTTRRRTPCRASSATSRTASVRWLPRASRARRSYSG